MLAIQTKGLTKQYKKKKAVDSLDFSVEQGTLYALLGVNGAGKSTTVKMLSGLISPTSGDAFLLGKSIVSSPGKVKPFLNVSPQETAVAPNLTVFENLELICGIYGHSSKTAKEKAAEMIASFGFKEIAEDKAKTLSGGWKRRLSIAMALVSEPQILFLDEPTLGLDVVARRELWRLIEELKGKITVILTTHYLEEAEALSDKIGVMLNGKLVAEGTAAELMKKTQTETLEDAFLSLSGKGMFDENAFVCPEKHKRNPAGQGQPVFRACFSVDFAFFAICHSGKYSGQPV